MSAPLISTVTPASGPAGTLVTIMGSGLLEVDTVAFGATDAPLLGQTDSAVQVAVPDGLVGTQTLTVAFTDTVVAAGGFAVTGVIGPPTPATNYTPILVGGLAIAAATLVLSLREHKERDDDRARRRR